GSYKVSGCHCLFLHGGVGVFRRTQGSLYKDVMMDNQPPLTSPDGSSHGNPPERCPRPLYSRDSTQEGHTIPHHHQSGNLRDPKVEVKEEIKEEEDEDGGMEESELLRRTQRSVPGHHGGVIQLQEPTREMSPSSVFPGFHTGRSHHPSPSSEWNPRG
ncbi:unnamed protein product, partial [Staurois parvus]